MSTLFDSRQRRNIAIWALVGLFLLATSAIFVLIATEKISPPPLPELPKSPAEVIGLILACTCGLLAPMWLEARRELNKISTPEMRKLFRSVDDAEFLDGCIELHRQRREQEWAEERAAWLAERDEWKARTMVELYETIIAQVDRGVLKPGDSTDMD